MCSTLLPSRWIFLTQVEVICSPHSSQPPSTMWTQEVMPHKRLQFFAPRPHLRHLCILPLSPARSAVRRCGRPGPLPSSYNADLPNISSRKFKICASRATNEEAGSGWRSPRCSWLELKPWGRGRLWPGVTQYKASCLA